MKHVMGAVLAVTAVLWAAGAGADSREPRPGCLSEDSIQGKRVTVTNTCSRDMYVHVDVKNGSDDRFVVEEGQTREWHIGNHPLWQSVRRTECVENAMDGNGYHCKENNRSFVPGEKFDRDYFNSKQEAEFYITTLIGNGSGSNACETLHSDGGDCCVDTDDMDAVESVWRNKWKAKYFAPSGCSVNMDHEPDWAS